ncbi:MAG: hypothetical protein WBD47_18375 [Phormidesmis sp.]
MTSFSKTQRQRALGAFPSIGGTIRYTLLGAVALALGLASPSLAQVDASADTPVEASRVSVASPAAPTSMPTPFSPALSGIVNLSADADSITSVGQLRPFEVETLIDDDVSWLQSVELPLYISPGGEQWGWIYQGWLIPNRQSPLAIGRDAGFAMVQAYENLYTFPVLEIRDDGWFRVQYTEGGSAWAHTSQLALGEMPLAVEEWSSLLENQESVYFLETGQAQPLRSQPQAATNMLSLIPADSLIKPTVFQGDWMLVQVTRPVANCIPLTGATVSEGWMRWRTDDDESLVWYRPDGGCSR